ncbi:hypothetical protein [Streptomyces narbonensis]|uniref:hypothetical protein n=1 Tax=Streptomyces narbonensis TaxID=67333 RepID=UPI001672E3B3|nr:hypothetical protein [Streptomyces narbonensis]GGW08748.1 hypothetical protein GCM10010230_56340 [Streptomyces narbonensis]
MSTQTTTSTAELAAARRQLWAALEARDEPAATAAVLGAHDAGVPAEDLLLGVIGHTRTETAEPDGDTPSGAAEGPRPGAP